jgi:hypothetical protein
VITQGAALRHSTGACGVRDVASRVGRGWDGEAAESKITTVITMAATSSTATARTR